MSHPESPARTGRSGRRALVASGAAAALVVASLTAGSTGASANPAPAIPTVDAAVYEELAEHGSTEFFVYLTETADLSGSDELTTRSAKAEYVYAELNRVAETSQADLRAALDARGIDYTPFWAVNTLLVEGDRALVDELAARPDVANIEANHEYEVFATPGNELAAAINQVEWGVRDIYAPRVWERYGIRGQRITVASIDTGVEHTHPALVNQYRGNIGGGAFNHNYNWFDPAGICPPGVPCDNNGHGTHVTGTMVGYDGGANQIGVAPRARWIAAKGCEFNSCSQASLLASGQWMLAPTDLNGNNPAPSRAPHVVNNSWGGAGGNTWYQGIITAWVQADIFPVFAAGNSGPACGSASSPGDNRPAYAVGAYDINHNIAWFSGRGPSQVDGSNKPNIAAPGVDVRSSLPGGAYGSLNGTSMAAPHVAGTVALVWSAALAYSASPYRDVPLTRRVLDATATDVSDLQCGGSPFNNNVWGEGRVNAYAAVQLGITL